jgi:hypothetical protein
MNPYVAALVAIACCGGQVEPGTAGAGGGGGPSESVGSAASRPAPGTSACDMNGTVIGPITCILCSDDQLHCLGTSYPQCPPGVDSCSAILDSGLAVPRCVT